MQSKELTDGATCFLSSSQLKGTERENVGSHGVAAVESWGKMRLCNSSGKEIQNPSSTNGSPQMYMHVSVCKISVTNCTLWVLRYCMPAPPLFHPDPRKAIKLLYFIYLKLARTNAHLKQPFVWKGSSLLQTRSDKWTFCFSLQKADRAVASLA